MEQSVVSIIIPIYNTEKYLRKCLDSTVKQTYKNLEIICVIDGSPDNSITICKEFASIDSRIKIINKTNGGLSSARNEGLRACQGRFITFLDSDDYLDFAAIENMVSNLNKFQADIVCIDKCDVDENNNILESSSSTYSDLLNTITFLERICDRSINCAVWGKLFKKELFSNITFNEERLNEDFLLLSEMLMGKDLTIALTSYRGYYYLERANSISRSGFGKSSRDAVYNTIEMTEKAQNVCSRLVPYYGAYAAYQARAAVILMNRIQYNNETDFVRLCRKTMIDNKRYFRSSVMSIKDRLFCYLYIYFPRMALLIAHKMIRS